MVGVASDQPLPEMRAGSFDDREFQLGLYAELQRRHIEMLHREAEVEDLRREIRAISERAAQREAELRGQREESLRREGEAEYLRKEHSAARAREIGREAELLRRHYESSRQEEKLAKLETTLASVQGELDSVHERLSRDSGTLRTEAERLAREATAYRIEARNLSLENGVLEDHVVDLETSLRQTEAALGQTQSELVQTQLELTGTKEDLRQVQSEAARSDQESIALLKSVAEAEATLRRKSEELLRAQAEAARLKQDSEVLKQRNRLPSDTPVRGAGRDAESPRQNGPDGGGLSCGGEQSDDAAGFHRQEIADLHAKVETVENSLSWKITAPLRWIGRLPARIWAVPLKWMYASHAFRSTGKRLARLISNVPVPGANWLLPRNPLFDARFYEARYRDAAKSSRNLWAHYLAYGSDEGRDPHPLFKGSHYKSNNPEVAASGPRTR